MLRVLIFYAKPLPSDQAGPANGPDRPDACLVFWHDMCVGELVQRLRREGAEVRVRDDEQMGKAAVLSTLLASTDIDVAVFFGHGRAQPPWQIVNRRKAPSGVLVDEAVILAGPRRCQCLLACLSGAMFAPVAKQAQLESLLGFMSTACAPKLGWETWIPDPKAREDIAGFHRVVFVDATVAAVLPPTHGARTIAVNEIKARLRNAAEQLRLLWLLSKNDHIGAFAIALSRNASSLCCLP